MTLSDLFTVCQPDIQVVTQYVWNISLAMQRVE